MNRFQFALDVATGPDILSLTALARGFADAVEMAVAEEIEPEEDPAVLLLGSFIAFHVHADVNSANGYQKLLMLCAHQVNTTPVIQ